MPLEENPDRLTDRDNAVELVLHDVWEKHPQVLAAALWEAGDEDSVVIEVRVKLKGITSRTPINTAVELQDAVQSILDDLWVERGRKPQPIGGPGGGDPEAERVADERFRAANSELAQVAAERREATTPCNLCLRPTVNLCYSRSLQKQVPICDHCLDRPDASFL